MTGALSIICYLQKRNYGEASARRRGKRVWEMWALAELSCIGCKRIGEQVINKKEKENESSYMKISQTVQGITGVSSFHFIC